MLFSNSTVLISLSLSEYEGSDLPYSLTSRNLKTSVFARLVIVHVDCWLIYNISLSLSLYPSLTLAVQNHVVRHVYT